MLSVAALVSLACILAVWALYPALVGLVAAVVRRRGPRDARAPGALPRVTAVVATRADAIAVRERVDDLLRSEYPASLLDVVVAYDARTTEAMATWSGPFEKRTTRPKSPSAFALIVPASATSGWP